MTLNNASFAGSVLYLTPMTSIFLCQPSLTYLCSKHSYTSKDTRNFQRISLCTRNPEYRAEGSLQLIAGVWS